MFKKVAVIGLGYVGLPLAVLISRKGYEVIGIDSSKSKVKLLNKKTSPFYDPELQDDLKKINLVATSSYKAVGESDIVIVCVPTPVDNGYMPDLGPLKAVCTQIAKNLGEKQLIIIESTINPGVCDEVLVPLLESISGKKCGQDFLLAHCPERINPGDKAWDVSNIPRVVGGFDEDSLEVAKAFYESIVRGTIKPMASLKEAEAVKVVENSFRDVNIAFVNELAMSFDKLGIDVVNVIDGAATKPFAFMPHYPGAGVGGHCIPVDPYYLIEYAKKNGFTHKFLRMAREVNNGMPYFVVGLLQKALNEAGLPLKNSKITVLGLSYKPNVGDLRESPSIEIINDLKKAGAKVVAYDPYIKDSKLVKCKIKKTLKDAVKNSDAIVVATAHQEFIDINKDQLANMNFVAVIDGRNCLDKNLYTQLGFIYRGVGR